jgi:hypothetical protein
LNEGTADFAAAAPDAGALARAHPLTMFGLDALVAGATRLRPDRLALRDSGGADRRELSFAELDRAIGAFLARLRGFDLARGERVLLCCAPASEAIIALTALVAAGLEPVLAPLQTPPGVLARAASAVAAAAIVAPTRFDRLDLEATLLGVAAQTPSIRLLGTLGPETIDGAVDFSLGALHGSSPARAKLHDGWTSGARAMIGAIDEAGAPVFISQGALLGHGLDLVRKTRRGGSAPVVSLVAPASFGGLIAGPLAALLAGAPTCFLAPFRAADFLALLDEIGPARLVAPTAILPDLARAGLLDNGALVSVVALSRRGGEHVEAPRHPSTCPIVEIVGDGRAIHIAPPPPHEKSAASQVA